MKLSPMKAVGLNVMTATITDPLTGTVLASTSLGNPGDAIEGIGNIGALFLPVKLVATLA